MKRVILLAISIFASAQVASAATIALESAYRDSGRIDGARTVILQGARTGNAPLLSAACGKRGESCVCEFFKADRSITLSNALTLSSPTNQIRCKIGGNANPDLFRQVRLRTTDSRNASATIAIREALWNANEVVRLDPEKIHKIYRYSCARTFIEADGVDPIRRTLSCYSNQSLNLLRSAYPFYLYASAGEGGNIDTERFRNQPFTTALCGFNAGPEYSCGKPELRYGLYSESSAPFVVAVSLSTKPVGEVKDATRGYAALPNALGECPTGLVPARPYRAVPKSVGLGFPEAGNLPSTFVNSTHSLSAVAVETEDGAPDPFTQWRFENTGEIYPRGRCSSDQSTNPPYLCDQVKFKPKVLFQNVPYTAETPVICVIPKYRILE